MDKRPPSEQELELLTIILRGEFPGAPELRGQLVGLRVRPGCACGCGTLELLPDPETAASIATSGSADGLVLDASGSEIGGLLLFVREGRLSSLEVYSFSEPLQMPDPSAVRWRF